MKRTQLRFGRGFRVALGNACSQAAQMVIAPGDKEGGSDNAHGGADQWLYVVAGTGTAIVNGKRHPLRAGTLVLIERGDKHEIRASGRKALETVSIYVPPAYTAGGNELPAGKP
jgi:mannose-6-phosphate isomerase-like protein (cupin superfamily)